MTNNSLLTRKFINSFRELNKVNMEHSSSINSVYNQISSILQHIHASNQSYLIQPYNDLFKSFILKGSTLKSNYIAEIKECSITNGSTSYIAHKIIPKLKLGLSNITNNHQLYYCGFYKGDYENIHSANRTDLANIINRDISLVEKMA